MELHCKPWLPWSVWAAVTEYHRLGGFSVPEIYFSQLWTLRSKGSGRGQIRCLVRAHFLVRGQLSGHYVLTGRTGSGDRGKELSGVSFGKAPLP